jgi:outer membrane scaffolding protein for murein synthesis (MipA/OmpV family)
MTCILLKGSFHPVRALSSWALSMLALGAAVSARGQDETPPPAEETQAVPAEKPQDASGEKPQDAHAEPVASPRPPSPSPHIPFEGAIGPVVSINPEYQGGVRLSTKVTPGIFIRWGRFTLTNASGFVTRREEDDVFRGLAADFVRSKQWRVNLALRIDRGRDAGDSAALSGLQNVRSTLRGRLIVTHWFDEGAAATLGTSVDLLGHGGGTLVDMGLNQAFPIAPKGSWNIGLTVTAADQRYMQSYFGVMAQQAASSGYAVYTPGSGWRDVAAGIGLRGELGNRWIGFANFSRSRLLGPASASPLSQQRWSWGINGGLGWRF